MEMPQYNFILAGRAGVGKTQLFNYIKTGIAPKHDPDYADDSRTTMTPLGDTGLERLEHETFVNGRQVKVNLWDTGGQERYDSMTANYYRHANAVILVYDLETEATLFSLSEWISEARKNSRWNDRLVFALWGNKADTEIISTRDEAILAFMSSNDIPVDLSAKVSVHKSGTVEQAFQSLIEIVDKKCHQTPAEENDRDTNRLILSFEEPGSNRSKNKCFCLS